MSLVKGWGSRETFEKGELTGGNAKRERVENPRGPPERGKNPRKMV